MLWLFCVSLYSQRIRQNENMTTGGRENILLRVLTMYGRLLPGGRCAAAAAPRPQAPVATAPTAPSEATQGCGTQQRAQKCAASAHQNLYDGGAGGVGGGASAPGGGPPAFCYRSGELAGG